MAKSKKPKPSFDAPAAPTPAKAPEWVYRSDAPKGASAAKAASSAKAAGAPTPKAAKAPKADDTPKAKETPSATATAPLTDRPRGANALIERYATYSAAAGLVPVPAVDAAAIAGVQVAMLRAVSAHYDVPFSEDRGKALIAALVGGLMPSLAGYQFLTLVGPLAGILGISGFAMTSTWAVGQLFVSHFESGGTLLDLNVEQSRAQLKTAIKRT
jgi:uncharacterized protein (DUF697 family)